MITAPEPLDLDAIRARCAAATEGPWRWTGNVDHDDPRLTGRKTDVFAITRRERTRDDREAQGFADYLREVQEWDKVKEEWRHLTDEEIEAQVRRDWLEEPDGEPRYDMRLSFVDPERHVYRNARDLAVFAVCPDATSREDERVYRADIAGLRHPDAVFIAAARTDVENLLAEVARLRARESALRNLCAPADQYRADDPESVEGRAAYMRLEADEP